MLRVVHVVCRLDVGGLEVGLVNLIPRLRQLSFEQAVCCLQERGALADRLPADTPVWTCAPCRRRLWHKLPFRAARLLASFRPDVIHVRNCAAWPDTVLAWLLGRRPGQVVFSLEGWNQVEPLAPRRAFLYRQLARCTARLAAVSRETADQFAHETGLPPSRFAIIHSGVDTERFRPRLENEAGSTGRRLVIGCVARLDPIKDHELLLRAAARLAREDNLDVEVRLLGDGPRRAALEGVARECGLGERVHFLGMVADIPEQLRQLDVFVLPSFREGRPISIMEAMASGLPVVASAVGSVAGMIEEGRTGMLIGAGDLEGLCAALRLLANDGELRQRLGQAGRAKAVREMSLDRMVQDYAAFYHEAAPARRLGQSPAAAGPLGSEV